MEHTINHNNLIVNSAVLLYFSTLIIVNQTSGMIVSLLWYFTVAFCVVAELYICRLVLDLRRIVFTVIMIITGWANMTFIGTTDARIQMLLVAYIMISPLLLSDYLSSRVLLFAFFMNVIIVVMRFLMVGFGGQIYTNSSSNFVSIFLLYPIIIYYVLLEKRRQPIHLYPAAIFWIICLISRGRGGIITATFFLIGVILTTYKDSKKMWKVFVTITAIIVFTFLILNIDRIIVFLSSSVITEYFRDRGLKSSRIVIWEDYINHATSSREQLIFGADISETVAGLLFSGNPHNSFINIHMHNGIIMLFAVVIIAFFRIIMSLKNRKYMYSVCSLAFLLRAFTDSVFWGPYGTPVLFFLLFYTGEDQHKCLMK